jgi:hypothetical protein
MTGRACLREQARTRARWACDQSAQPRTARMTHMVDECGGGEQVSGRVDEAERVKARVREEERDAEISG